MHSANSQASEHLSKPMHIITSQTTFDHVSIFQSWSARVAGMLEAHRQRRLHARSVQFYRDLDPAILDDLGLNLRKLYQACPEITVLPDTD